MTLALFWRTYLQVAHDIRSPLTALDVVLGSVTTLPEESRILVRAATQRIRDIANNLLTRTTKEPGAGKYSVELMSSLIDQLVSEKRFQFSAKIGVEIISELASDSYGIFAKVDPVELKRVISNLVNNSVEAIPSDGRVVLGLVVKGESAVVSITDNGGGIAPEILEKLGESGFSHGKEGTDSGSGLGLHHAKKSLSAWGGTLCIHSELGVCTTVEITLPLAIAPFWFVPALKIDASTEVIVLDDDVSIHSIWKNRLGNLSESNRLHHFSSGESLKKHLSGRGKENLLFLLDYELIGDQMTGLDWAEDLELENQSILVTSRYEDKTILKRCQRLGMRIIPKSLAAWVPVRATKSRIQF